MCALVTGAGGAVGRRARAALRGPQLAHRQGRAAVARAAAAPAARPVGPPARRRPGHARGRDRAGRAVRQLGGAARGEPAARSRRQRRRLRRDRRGASPGPTEFDRIVQGDVLVTESTTEAFNILLPLLGAIVTDAGGLLSHSAIVAREYGIPGVVGTRERDRPHPRRHARPGRRRRGRSDGLRRDAEPRSSRSPTRTTTSRFGAKATGLGAAARAGLPIPPGIALSGAIVDAGRRRARATPSRAARDRGPVARRRRSRCARRRSTRTAPTRASPASTSRCSTCRRSTTCARRSGRSGGRRTPTRRSPTASASASSRGRASASSSSRCSIPTPPGVMFTQNPINGADERLIEASWGLGEVVVAGRVIPDSFRIDRAGAVLERTPGLQEDRDPRRGRRRHLRGDGRAGARRAAVPRRRSARAAATRSPTRCEEVYGPARDIEWAFAGGQLYLLQCRAVTRAGIVAAAAARRRSTADRSRSIEHVPLFANMSPRDVEGIAALFKERRFAAGETITKEGAGGAAFFVIESGEATVIDRRPASSRRLDGRRLLRRDRAHRRGRALGDDHRDDRARLLRAHLLGVPTARAAERDDRLEPAADPRPPAAHRAGRRSFCDGRCDDIDTVEDLHRWT